MIISFIGPRGSGKTTIADAVRDRTNSIHISIADVAEAEDARAVAMLGRLARMLTAKQDKTVIVDFVGKSQEVRDAFGHSDLLIWVDTISNAEDWEAPELYDHKIVNTGNDHEDQLSTRAITVVRRYGLLDWKPEQILMSGTFQDWGKSHVEKYNELAKSGPVTIGIKHSIGMKPENVLFPNQILQKIMADIPNVNAILIPNVSNVVDVD